MKELTFGKNRSEIVIKKHKFLEAKENIKKFSDELPKEVELNKFETSGTILGFTDHNVTGDEMNDFVAELQQILAFEKSVDIRIIDKFNEVYIALEALDSEYVPAILTAIKSTEEASFQAKEASDQALKAQDDTNKVIEQLKRHIKILQTFKDKIEKLEHIHEVDAIWDNLTNTNKANSTRFENIYTKYTTLLSKYSKLDEARENLTVVTDGLEKQQEETKGKIANLGSRISDANSTIQKHDELINQVCKENEAFAKHLSELDEARENLTVVTDGLEKQQEEIKGKIANLGSGISDANSTIQKHDELINQVCKENEAFAKHLSELDEAQENLTVVTDGLEKQQVETKDKISALDNEYRILDSEYKKLYNKYIVALSISLLSSIISMVSLVWGR